MRQGTKQQDEASKRIVLVIDDDTSNLDVIRGFLQENGFDVAIAASSDSGWERARRIKPEVILLDVNMPGMDGFEVCEKLKQDEATQAIPIIFLTAQTDVESKIRGFQLGAVDYIEKPVQKEELIVRVTTHMEVFRYRNHLEDEVRARTAELEESNRKLLHEIQERKLAEEEKRQLEDQLRHAQKLEAIGTLAGGVAHDFNNILTAILGYSGMFLTESNPQDRFYEEIQMIQKAGERASLLTQQLLAFSRKQMIQPRILDINETLFDLKKMLQRILVENIEFSIVQDSDTGKIKIDPGQIDQIIMNLTVNARDAMPNGGKFIIETKNTQLDDEYCKTHTEIKPGDYVLIAISDTGHGIPKEILDKIFEPFFTTKDKTKGTGLGLSTVYGIVKQNEGHISVYSEPDKGTTFKIYLPRVDDEPKTAEIKETIQKDLNGSESILIVEDEDLVRTFMVNTFENYGYTAHDANSYDEAIQVMHNLHGEIDLLVTDVVLPQKSGKEVARSLCEYKPSLKVIYMSGYTDNIIAHHQIIEEGIEFLHKPFTTKGLLKKAREILDLDT